MTPAHRRPPADEGNPYRVPRPAVVSFSGGRTSAYMLKHIIDAHGGELPDDVAVVYANTGLERPETLDFIDTCATAWGVPIVWVEYDWDAPHRTRLVDYRTASRKGEPYAALIERKGFVPNATPRYCTGFLKRDRIESYARYRLGLKRWHAVIGLRADEPRRVTHLMYYEGAHMLARDLGFMNAPALKGWAERHPEIWGNRHGGRMFAGDGAVAFGNPPFAPVLVSGIVAWWRAVADRLDAAIPVQRDRADALAAHARHDPEAWQGIAVEPCEGGWRLVRRPYPELLPSLPA